MQPPCRRPAHNRISASQCTDGGMIGCMDVLSSRILLRPADLERSRRFYRDTLGLAVYREFGDRDDPGLVFFLGGGTWRSPVSGTGRRLVISPSGYRSATSLPNSSAFKRPVLRSRVHPNANPGVCWRCGSPIRTGYASFSLKSQHNTHYDAITGEAPRLAHRATQMTPANLLTRTLTVSAQRGRRGRRPR